MKPAKTSLHQLLLARSQWMNARLMEGAARHGYGEVTDAMSRMFAHLAGRPVGLSELARLLAVSRQAVHQLANEAAALGLVEFVPSESDGRVKLLRFTQKGWDMSDTAVCEIEAIEAALAAQIGATDLAELKRILARPWVAGEAV
ncbi:MAG: helix-turn-helix domain-containing protein [Burkholderiaceae bacterium]|nr:helix-turn-helix domain-containing protein [Burkholderiaceae bacterium]